VPIPCGSQTGETTNRVEHPAGSEHDEQRARDPRHRKLDRRLLGGAPQQLVDLGRHGHPRFPRERLAHSVLVSPGDREKNHGEEDVPRALKILSHRDRADRDAGHREKSEGPRHKALDLPRAGRVAHRARGLVREERDRGEPGRAEPDQHRREKEELVGPVEGILRLAG